jgi:hypothetical protein
MGWVDNSGRPLRNAGAPQSWRRRMAFARLLPSIVAVALAGCSEGPGTLLIDPGRYSAYHCKDIAAQWKVLTAREKELRDLMARANQGGGGAVIGSLAYRTDYETVRSEERLLQREAAEKNCNSTPQSAIQSTPQPATQSTIQATPQPPAQFQSDQAIR